MSFNRCNGRLFTAKDNNKQYYICSYSHEVVQINEMEGICPICDCGLEITYCKPKEINIRRTVSFASLDELIMPD